MGSDTLLEALGDAIAAAGGEEGPARLEAQLAGGDINQAIRIACGSKPYFVKLNRGDRLDMFAAEAEGLKALAEAGGLRCPAPVACGRAEGRAYLVLEHLELHGRGSGATLGEGLARLHRRLSTEHGWKRDNTIGATPQRNGPERDWIAFWRERRLGYQLDLAAHNGFGGRLQRRGALLLERFPGLFDGYDPAPSLLHGDLWGGNYAFLADGTPVVYDPAVYHGDRETDLAMTELFGGFDADFYAAYRANWPLDAGYASRRALYQLYHVLNHLNLFGGGYLAQAERLVETLLAELGH